MVIRRNNESQPEEKVSFHLLHTTPLCYASNLFRELDIFPSRNPWKLFIEMFEKFSVWKGRASSVWFALLCVLRWKIIINFFWEFYLPAELDLTNWKQYYITQVISSVFGYTFDRLWMFVQVRRLGNSRHLIIIIFRIESVRTVAWLGRSLEVGWVIG